MPPPVSLHSDLPNSGENKRKEGSGTNELAAKRRKEGIDDEPNAGQYPEHSGLSSPLPPYLISTSVSNIAVPSTPPSSQEEKSLKEIAALEKERDKPFFEETTSQHNKSILKYYWEKARIPIEIQKIILDTLKDVLDAEQKCIKSSRNPFKSSYNATRISYLTNITYLLNILDREFPTESVDKFIIRSEQTVLQIDVGTDYISELQVHKRASSAERLLKLILDPINVIREKRKRIIEFNPPVPLSTIVQKLFALAIYLRCHTRGFEEFDLIKSCLESNINNAPAPDSPPPLVHASVLNSGNLYSTPHDSLGTISSTDTAPSFLHTGSHNNSQNPYFCTLNPPNSPPPLVHVSVLNSGNLYSTPHDSLGTIPFSMDTAPSFLHAGIQHGLGNFPNEAYQDIASPMVDDSCHNNGVSVTPPDQTTDSRQQQEILDILRYLLEQKGPSTSVTSSDAQYSGCAHKER